MGRSVVIRGLWSLRYLKEPGPVLPSAELEGISFYGAKSSHVNLGFLYVTYDLPVELHRRVQGISPLPSALHRNLYLKIILTTRFTSQSSLNEGVDRGGGGTGIRWAESGVEGAESGVEGAESGVEGAGSGGRMGGKSGKIGAGNYFFFKWEIQRKWQF